MADVAKGYGVGDAVYVWYPGNVVPQARTVKKVDILDAGNEANVEFEEGSSVQDGAIQRVFDTEALCATAIIDDNIVQTAATVVLEGGADTTLVRTP